MIFSKCTGLGDGQHGAGGEEHPGPLQQLQASQEQPQGIALCSVLHEVKNLHCLLFVKIVTSSTVPYQPGFRIHIHFFKRIRIRIQGFDDQKLEKIHTYTKKMKKILDKKLEFKYP
jgi:hypothetical protein